MPVLRPDPVESVGELYDYELVAFTGESRSPRSSGPIRLSVDQSREVSAAVTSNDGRIKVSMFVSSPSSFFFSIRHFGDFRCRIPLCVFISAAVFSSH